MASKPNVAGRAVPNVVCMTPKIVAGIFLKDKSCVISNPDVAGGSKLSEKGISVDSKPTETTQLVALPRVAGRPNVKSSTDGATKQVKMSASNIVGKAGDAPLDQTIENKQTSLKVTSKSQSLRPSTAESVVTASSTDDQNIHECHICKAFFMLSSLKQHAKTHTQNQDTEVCSKCGGFERNGGPLKNHLCYICMKCSTTYDSLNSLNEHMLLHDIQHYQKAWGVAKKKKKKRKKSRKENREKSPKENREKSPKENHEKSPKENHEKSPKENHEKSLMDNHDKSPKENHEKSPKENHEKSLMDNHDKSPKENHEKLPKEKHEKLPKEKHEKSRKENHEKSPKENHEKSLKENHEKSRKENHEKSRKENHEKSRKANHDSKSPVVEKARRGRWIEKEVDPTTNKTYLQSCSECNKFFSSQSNLENHVKDLHTGVNTAVCDICGHFEENGGELRPHLCQTDAQRGIATYFKTTYKKKEHQRAVLKEEKKKKRHRCAMCFRSYAYLQGLRAHMHTHKAPSDRPFQCNACGKAFAKKTLYQDHSRIHTGEKPYLCHLCAKTFRSGANLRQHQRRCKERQQAIHRKEEPVTYELAMEIIQEGDETFLIQVDPNRGNRGRTDEPSGHNAGTTGKVVPCSTDHAYTSDITGMVRMPVPGMPVHTQSTQEQPKMENENQDLVDYHRNDTPMEGCEPGEVVTEIARNETVEDSGVDYIDYPFPEPSSTPAPEPPTPAPPAGLSGTDHDYSKDHPKNVLGEHPVGDNIQADYLEVCFMCTKCYVLNDCKLTHKHHMRKHGKITEVSEGILVLARPQHLDSFDGSEEDIIPLAMFYQCSHCNKPFPVDDIEKHLDSLEITDEMCKICYRIHKASSKSKCKLSRARKVFQCPYCSVSPLTRCDLKNHLMSKHGGAEYTCSVCQQKFKSRRSLASHSHIHRKKPEGEPKLTKVQRKYYPCTKCDKVLTDRSQLRIHLMHHSDPKPFACKLCSKKYPFPSALRVHMRGHTKKFPFLCEYCSKAFKVKACLQDHIRCHTGDKPFVCELCAKKFRTKANMRQHSQRCTVSGSVTQASVDKLRPTNLAGDYDETFFCEICGKLFEAKANLLQHSQSCHRTIEAHDKSYFVVIPQEVSHEVGVHVESSYQEVPLSVNAAHNQ